MASKSNIDLMNHMSGMLLHLNILNAALLMRLYSIYIEDLLGETASSAYEIRGTQKDLRFLMLFIDNSVGACFLLGHPIDCRCVNLTCVSFRCVSHC